jgi:hypothetical protein
VSLFQVISLKTNPAHTDFTFAAHFLMRFRFLCSLCEQFFSPFYQSFGSKVVMKSPQLVIFFSIRFHGQFYSNLGTWFVMISLQTVGISKTAFPKHDRAMQGKWGSSNWPQTGVSSRQ